MKNKGFKEENFAKYHPGGSLGRKLILTVKDSLTKGVYVQQSDSFVDVISLMCKSATGAVLVGSSSNLQGIITDGDIRKYLGKTNENDFLNTTASMLMTKNPKVISSLTKCGDADKKMFEEGVNSLIVKDGDTIVGIYDNLNRR